MEKVKVYYHKDSDTMDIWFGNPKDEVMSEEAGEGIIFKKNKYGEIIGIEKLYVSKTVGIDATLPAVQVELVFA